MKYYDAHIHFFITDMAYWVSFMEKDPVSYKSQKNYKSYMCHEVWS